jgi:predicted DNA-binding protein YlxM (UPF0122 family)
VCLLLVISTALPAAAAEIRPLLLDAQAQYEQSHYEQALKLYQQADQAEPGHAAVEYNIGMCHLSLDDPEKAIQQFERVASRSEVNRTLQRDAFYNIGLVRATSARSQLKDLLAPATQPSEQKPAADDPASIPKLEAIADDLLKAIAGFRKAAEIQPDADAEHNIRAARITRRDVLGLLRKAAEAKQKDDMLKDPRAYLQALIHEQEQQVSLGRLLILQPPEDLAESRQARRAGLRAQRKIMENTGEFADNLAQFRESAAPAQPDATASAPTSQPEETPREKVYRAAAKQLTTAIEAQRDACAYLLDNNIEKANEQQSAAREQMYTALYLFPLDPAQALVATRTQQGQLQELVDTIKTAEHWLRDPLLPEVEISAVTGADADKTPIHHTQTRIGTSLALLHRQCEYVAATSQPAEQSSGAQEPPEPMLDPELNRKLADVLKKSEAPQADSLTAIVARERKATLAAQDELIKIMDAALDLLPKTLEQRITELIVRQARLNSEVQAEAGAPARRADGNTPTPAGEALDEIRKWATRLKSRLLGGKPAQLAERLRGRQQEIRTDTAAVDEEIRQQIPAGADAAPTAGSPPPASQPAELKAHIEASKHLTEAGNHMEEAAKGFEQVVVENSLRPMQPEEAVQKSQAKALEELVKALAALKPPSTQPSEDSEQENQQQQPQPRQQEQDLQRELERMERERERAERELHKRSTRTIIKDW